MSVTLTCDICKQTQLVPPGEHSMYTGPAKGWIWIYPASFNQHYRIDEETRCPECQTAIDVAKHNAELTTRERLKR